MSSPSSRKEVEDEDIDHEDRASTRSAIHRNRQPVCTDDPFRLEANRHDPTTLAAAEKGGGVPMNAGKARLLLVGGITPLERYLCQILEDKDYATLRASSCTRGETMAHGYAPDLILLDLDLPGGETFITSIRQSLHIPLIALSENTGVAHKVRALDLGADDYLTKPWNPDELLARIRALLRRATSRVDGLADESILSSYDRALVLDVGRHEVRMGSQAVPLTPKEFALLSLLMRHTGKVLTHRSLLQQVWGTGYEEETGYVRVYIAQLRSKLPGDYILTQPNVGYLFRDSESSAGQKKAGGRRSLSEL